jgi:HlyD family secretion protein
LTPQVTQPPTSSLSRDLASLTIERGAPLRSSRRCGVGALLVALSLIGLGVGFTPAWLGDRFAAEVDLIEIAESSAAPAIELSSTGYVVAQVHSTIAAKLPGRVAALFVRRGQRVEIGQALLRLESAQAQAALRVAQLRAAGARRRVDAALAQLAELSGGAARAAALAKQGAGPVVAATDLLARADVVKAAVEVARADVAAIDGETSALALTLDDLTLRAAIAGTVLNEPPQVGQMLGQDGDLGSSDAIQLADYDSLLIETDVPETRLAQVSLGRPCEIALDAYPELRLRGQTFAIMPQVDRAKATVAVQIKFNDRNELVRPGMAARISFLAEPVPDHVLPKLIVPAEALTRRDGRQVVFVVEQGRARLRAVRLGAAHGGGFELLAGPPRATKLVKAPAASLRNGQRIRDRTQS